MLKFAMSLHLASLINLVGKSDDELLAFIASGFAKQ
jgi:hypothetical protein